MVDPATAHLEPTGPRPGLVAFGEALDGATRIAPDARSYHIVESIILETAVDEQARGFPNGEVTGWADTFSRVDLIHPELRPYLGNIVDYYIQDVFWALADPDGGGVSDNPPYQQRLDLDNLKPHHLQRTQALLYPDEHLRAGELIPFDQWQFEQFTVWGLYITADGTQSPMIEAVYDLMIEEVTPTEFVSTVHEGGDWNVVQLIYPPGHPREGQFIPRAEWTTVRQGGGWQSYLISRPRHLGCPYGEEPEPPPAPRAPAR